MTVMDDTLRGLTLGDPDGPLRYVETLDREVPTYIDPRDDLKPPGEKTGTYKRLDYHVPFTLRGEFKPSDWPQAYALKAGRVPTDVEGYVLCSAHAAHGGLCANKAVNRTHFCRNHGGALHRCDKKMSNQTIAPMSAERIDKLNRIQKFMQGLLLPEELEDDEVQGGFVRNEDGQPIKSRLLGVKFEQQIAKELHNRLNRFLQSKASSMLSVMVDVAENDLYEAADRIKAAIWVSERVMGKTPEVIVHGTTQAPYASILESIESGSREDYRKHVASERGQVNIVDELSEALDVDEVSEVGDCRSYRVDYVTDGKSESDPRIQDRRERDSEQSHLDSEIVEDSGDDNSVQERAEQIVQSRVDRIAAAKRMRKAKQRRYAARATGASSLSRIPWLLNITPIRGTTKYKLGFILPDKITPAVMEKYLESRCWEVTEQEVTRRRAEAADEEVRSLEGKLAKLRDEADSSSHGEDS